MDEEQEIKVTPVLGLESAGEDETLMEGAWADILGSGQLKKKV